MMGHTTDSSEFSPSATYEEDPVSLTEYGF